MAIRMAGQDQPWVLPGPDGTVSILGVVFEGEEPVVDNGALHSRSHLEVGIASWGDAAARERGERLVSAWVAFPGTLNPPRYAGAMSVEHWIDRASGRGWKDLASHVNRMTGAVRGRVELVHLSPGQRANLGKLLATLFPAAWEASPELRAACA